MPKRTNETITLGSGKLYCLEYDSATGIPANATIEQDPNRLAYIKGGASISYSPDYYTAEDDLGIVKKRTINTEEVKFKSGIMTWNGDVLKKLCNTGRTTTANGIRITKIGGTGNYDGKSYIFHFVHEDAVDGDVRITIVGQNTAGFELAFAKDKETVVDAEISALPSDTDGTLIIFQEEVSTVSL